MLRMSWSALNLHGLCKFERSKCGSNELVIATLCSGDARSDVFFCLGPVSSVLGGFFEWWGWSSLAPRLSAGESGAQ